MILKAVDSGPKTFRDLQTEVLESEKLPRNVPPPHPRQAIQMPWPDNPDWRPDHSDPVIARIRMLRAARSAMAELAHAGALDELEEIEGADSPDFEVKVSRGSDPIDFPALKFGPALAERYGLARREGLDEVGLLDVDVFTADLEALGLDRRTLRCLQEALSAYRRGLYLSAVNLLGAVSEGAWYAAGEQLRSLSSSIANALVRRDTFKVISGVAEQLKATKSVTPSARRELEVHAAYLRDLRNYGVHPRGESSTSLEHAFSEHGAGLLLMETHRYLVRLAEATEAALRSHDVGT